MGCNCLKGAVKFQVTLPSGSTFADGKTTRLYATNSEAQLAVRTYPGATIQPTR